MEHILCYWLSHTRGLSRKWKMSKPKQKDVKWQRYKTVSYNGCYDNSMGLSKRMTTKGHDLSKVWIRLLSGENDLGQ